MKQARIKFSWGTPAHDQARWHAGLFSIHRRPAAGVPDFAYLSERLRNSYQKRTVFISVRGLLAWGVALAVAAYFAGAFVALQIQRRQPHCQITYADLVLPARWAGLDELRGAALLEQARDEFKAGRVMPGFHLLRAGLARKPSDTGARLNLSSIYLRLRLRHQSDKILLEAFDHGYPGAAYVSEAYATLALGDNPALLATFLKKASATLAAGGGGTDADSRLITERALDAEQRSGRHAEAVRLAARLYPENSDERMRVEIPAALAAEDWPRALALAAAWERRRPQEQEVLAMVAGVNRKAGRPDDMQAAIRRLRALNPAHAGHATFGVVQNHLAGREAAARDALEEWFFRYGGNETALAELTRDLSKVGADDLLARIEEFVRELGFDRQAVLVGRLFAQINARDWERAVATRARLEEIAPRIKPADRPSIEVATTLVTACADAGGGNQKVFIEAFLRSPGSLEFNRMLLEALIARGRFDTAAELITLVEGTYPESQYVRAAALRVKAGQDARTAAHNAARPVAKVSPARAFANGVALLAELDRLEAAGADEEATDLIRAVRRDAPAWLAGSAEALDRRELGLALRADDLPRLQLAARTYLRGKPERQAAALELAAGWHAQGRKTEAMLLVREILREKPDHPAALATLAAWTPKPAAPDAAEAGKAAKNAAVK